MVGHALYAPRVTVDAPQTTVRLGSKYGGWDFLEKPGLKDSVILSCGLGEDASFDVEFSKKYGATVLLVDPTPRAVEHYRKLVERLGKKAESDYVAGGNQPVEAYDMEGLSADSFKLIEKALWNKEETLKFFMPSQKGFVSHSLVNVSNNYRQDTAYLEVQGITMETLLKAHGVEKLPLMKMDIEGAEITVLNDMLDKNILPDQLLVEFDGLNNPSRRSRDEFEQVDSRLRKVGYGLVKRDEANFLYVRNSS